MIGKYYLLLMKSNMLFKSMQGGLDLADTPLSLPAYTRKSDVTCNHERPPYHKPSAETAQDRRTAETARRRP